MRTILHVLTMGFALTLTTSCSSAEPPAIEVQADISMCATGGEPCVSVPAAGATYAVYSSDRVIESGKLARAGEVTVPVGAGRFRVVIGDETLGLQSDPETVTVPEGDAGVVFLQVQLGSVTVVNN